jgi:DNA polymerase-1
MHDITAKALNCDRQLAKTLNFGILYGASKWKVKELFRCSEQEAQVIIDKFFRQFPGLKKIIDYCHERVERDEQITNPFGRTRTFKGQWTNRNELDRCKRQAFNSLIQGTGGDLTNISFYRISRELRSGKLGKAWFTVHDEVLVEARDGAVPEVKEIIKANMVGIGEEIGLLVPLSVEISEPMQRWEK